MIIKLVPTQFILDVHVFARVLVVTGEIRRQARVV